MIKVSVILPVYNTEKYLPECLDILIANISRDPEDGEDSFIYALFSALGVHDFPGKQAGLLHEDPYGMLYDSLAGSKEDQQRAMKAYLKGASMEKNKLVKSMAYHNLGVVCQTQKDLTHAIAFYKEALRNNPADEEARYNLVLCQHQLKNGGGGGGAKPQQDKDDKKGEDKQKKDEQQQQPQQSKQQPPQQNQMSKDNAEQLLDLSKQEEQQTRQKIRNAQPRTRSLEKNW